MYKTKIEWSESSWNPVTGCNHGCKYCYARNMVTRFGAKPDGIRHPGVPTHELSEPVKGENGKAQPYPYGFELTFHKYRLGIPQTWTQKRNTFVCSMADLFSYDVPQFWIEEVFAATQKAPQHNYLFLTKNPRRYVDLALHRETIDNPEWQAWFGTTMTGDAGELEERQRYIESLNFNHRLKTFISYEPLHGLIPPSLLMATKWVIVGAESGNRKGKIEPRKEWIEAIAVLCKEEGIPLFMKNSLAPVWGEPLIQEYPEGLK
jgi:protein gp37